MINKEPWVVCLSPPEPKPTILRSGWRRRGWWQANHLRLLPVNHGSDILIDVNGQFLCTSTDITTLAIGVFQDSPWLRE